MRCLLTIVLLLHLASPLRGQTAGDVEVVQELTVPAESTNPAPAGTVQPAVEQEPSAPAARAADPILDAGFWRSVLAGVIVTVISTLILRAIL